MAGSDPDLAAQLLAAFSAPPPEEKPEPAPEPAPVTQESIPHESTPQPPVAEPPPAPIKRPRSPEPDGHDGDISQKRLKADHNDLEHHGVDLSAANWDISAMIQNALGSFDEQLNQTHTEEDHGEVHGLPTYPEPPRPPVVKRIEQKRMTFASNPYYVMRTMSLPLLGSLAIQILLAISQQSMEETLGLTEDQESEFRKAYDTLNTALDHSRRIFSDSSRLLFPDDLEISDSDDRETIRMSNLAAISTSAIAGDGSMLADAHDNFSSIFIPEEGEFVNDLTSLYLNLKTQALLDSLSGVNTTPERSDVLDRFFPPNFDEVLKLRHGETIFHSGREELVAEVGSRRQTLLESILDDEKRQRLKEKYPTKDFLDTLVGYLQAHLPMVIDYAEKYGINIPVSEDSVINEPLETGGADDKHDDLSALLQSATSKLLEDIPLGNSDNIAEAADPLDSLGLGRLIQESLQSQTGNCKDEAPETSNGDGGGLFDSGGLASLIASKLSSEFDGLPSDTSNMATSQGQQHGPHLAGSGSIPSPYLAQYNQLSQTPYYSYTQPPPPPPPPVEAGSLPPNQTFPTSILYERARQAAVAKSSSAARREGIHSTRRAWTPEEEKALMAGLDMVKGPHWSQILSLFGANGSISDILKDRTQVQLKDKARNLKLFFLKTNSEMPYYLQCVTGELKTRAPGQAARKEAEEKARQNSEEEQARLQGIMTLASGLQHNHHPVSNAQGTPASTRTTPITPHAAIAIAPMTPSIGTIAPATPSIAATSSVTPSISSRPPAASSNISTGAPVTPSTSSGTGAPVTPARGAVGFSATTTTTSSVPPVPSTAVTTPASPVVVKSEPQDHHPVLIQPKPEPQPQRPPESHSQSGLPAAPPSVPQRPQIHAPLQDTRPPAGVPDAQPMQVSEGPQPQAPTAIETGTGNLAAQIAQFANQQQQQAPEQNEHDALRALLEHNENHETTTNGGRENHAVHQENNHIHHEEHREHHEEMNLLKTLQAAMAAAPSG